MKKRATIVSMLLILSMIMTGCSWSDFMNKMPWNSSKTSEYNPEDYITIGDYKGVEVDVTVTDSEVQSELDTLLTNNQETKEIKRKNAKKGDLVNIDYTGTVNKKKFDGGTASGQELELGSGSMIPGFEDGVIGMKVGETKNVKVTFPKDYQTESLQGKKANFKIKLNKIIEKITPKATDKNIAKFSEYKTLAEYKTATKKKLAQDKKDNLNTTAYSKFIETVKLKDNVPEELLTKYKNYYDKYWKSYLSYYGYDFDTFLTQNNMTEDQYKEQLVTVAKDLVKNYLTVRYITDKENVTMSDKDKEAQITELNTTYGTKDKAALEKQISEMFGLGLDEYVKDTFLEKKAAEVVGKYAKVKE